MAIKYPHMLALSIHDLHFSSLNVGKWDANNMYKWYHDNIGVISIYCDFDIIYMLVTSYLSGNGGFQVPG